MTPRATLALGFVALLLAASVPLALSGAGSRLAGILVDPFAPAPLSAPPTIRLASPADGAGVPSNVTIAGEARADAGRVVEDVELRVDGGGWTSLPDAPRGVALAPFSTPVELDAGDHLVEVRAWDGEAFSLPARALVRADSVAPPTVRLIEPTDGAGLAAGVVDVSGSASPDAQRILLAVGNATVNVTPVAGAWHARVPLAAGDSTIRALALRDDAESLPASVRVAAAATPPPSLAILGPYDGESFGSAGDPACPSACVLARGAATGAASVLVALDDGPWQNATLREGTWTFQISMDSLVAGPHRMALRPLAADGAAGVERDVAFLARTAREAAVRGDEAPRPTGTPLAFSAQGGNASQARWTLDGADAGAGPSTSVVLATPGPHVLAVALRDDHGRPARVEVPLLALNRPPLATLHAQAGLAVADTPFWAEASDADGAVVRYLWSFGDGATATTDAPTTSHRYAAEGLYRANLTAFDDQGAASATATLLVAIANAPPIAAFSSIPADPTVFDAVSFVDASHDPEGRLASWSWDFGDGATSASPDPVHRFATRGPHDVTLSVTDDEGAVATLAQRVVVRDIPPSPAFAWSPLAPRAGEDVVFADLSTKPDGAIANRSWSFGAWGPVARHAFPEPGTYDVTLALVDDLGATANLTRAIVVGDPAPQIRALVATPASPQAREPVAFEAQANDAMGSLAALAWDFGDGNASTDLAPTHAYARSGTYVVTLVARNDANATAEANITLRVRNAPPLAAMASASGFAGYPITLSGLASRDPDGRVVRWRFDADGDGFADCDGAVANCTFVYPTPGVYVANLTVEDDEGATGSVTAAVVVQAAPPVLAPPVVLVAKPAAQDRLAGSVLLLGSAASNRSIARVELQLRSGDRALALGASPWMPAQGGASWRLVLDTTAFPDGDYVLVARATDEPGAQGFAFVPVAIANGAPGSPLVLRIANAPLDPVGPDYDIEGSAYHPLGVTAVRWELDDGPWRDASGPPAAFELPLRGLTPGLHAVVVDAYRGVAEKRETRVLVQVAAPPPSLLVDVPPGPLAYGLLRAEGRVVGNGTAQWRLDTGLWRDLNATLGSWTLESTTRDVPAGKHAVAVRAIGPDGAASEPRAWTVQVVRPLGDMPFAGWGVDNVDGPSPTPSRQAPLGLLAPLVALVVAAATCGDVRRRL